MLKATLKNRKVLIVTFLVALVVGGVIGFEVKPLERLAARVYLATKQGKWQGNAAEKKKVKQVLSTVSKDTARSLNTLIIGTDKGSDPDEPGWCRSDVMILVCLQERDRKAVVISIPRDTMVQMPGYGTQKINAAHAYSGPSGAISAVKSLLGIDVHHYVELNFTGFQKMIDALGGVKVHIEKAIRDPHAGYVAAGDQVLDGWHSLVVCRSRNLLDGDIDRITNQQAFLRALFDKMNSEKSVWKGKQLLDIFASTCQSDFSAGQLLTLEEELRGFSPDNAEFLTLPGIQDYVDGLSYFLPEETQMRQVASEVIRDTWVTPETLASLEHESSYQADVQEEVDPTADVVSVLTGGDGEPQSASTLAEELKLMGHKTVRQDASPDSPEETVIYYRPEARSNCDRLLSQIPELKQIRLQENDQLTDKYNAPIVVALGSEFVTPPLVAVYGRLSEPAVDRQDLGRAIRYFH